MPNEGRIGLRYTDTLTLLAQTDGLSPHLSIKPQSIIYPLKLCVRMKNYLPQSLLLTAALLMLLCIPLPAQTTSIASVDEPGRLYRSQVRPVSAALSDPVGLGRIADFAVTPHHLSVLLSWSAPNMDQGSFRVERSADGRSWEQLAKLDAAQGERGFSYWDNAVLPQGQYFYRIVRLGHDGPVWRSQPLSVQVDSCLDEVFMVLLMVGALWWSTRLAGKLG